MMYDELVKRLRYCRDNAAVITDDELMAIADQAADVRPVVTCGDCVYAYPYGLEIKCTKHSGRADKFGEDATYSEFHEESWFCADGEARKCTNG